MSFVSPFVPSWSPSQRAGFTLVELMVVLAVVTVLATIFVPYLARSREADRRARCYDNLMHLSAALRDYAAENAHAYPSTVADRRLSGYVCFTDPVRPNDVTASLWLLVRHDLARPRDFTCPSTDDAADPVTDPAARNFRSSVTLSYSYACPFSNAPGYRLNDTRPPEFALIADRNPGPAAASVRGDAGPLEMEIGNSVNHGRSGQNVLYADGHADFCPSPFCGCAGDNIYTAMARRPHAGRSAGGWPGVVGTEVGPACESDSYLVPTAEEDRRESFPTPVQQLPARPTTGPVAIHRQ